MASLIHRDTVPGLTGLRFVAAFCVLIAHSVTVLMGGHEVYWIKQASGFGMTLFFVLSGFVIHYNYAMAITGRQVARGTAAFFWARFARLYPLLLLMLALYVLVSNRHFEFWNGRPERFFDVLRALPYFLLSIQSWLYFPVDNTSLMYAVGPSASLTWSISTEWFFYLVYPLAAWAIVVLRTPRSIAVAAVAWCALWIFATTGLDDRTPQLDAWAIAHFGPVAGAREHPDDCFCPVASLFFPLPENRRVHIGCVGCSVLRSPAGKNGNGSRKYIGGAIFIAAIDLELAGKAP